MQDDLDRTKDGLLKGRQCGRLALAHESRMSAIKGPKAEVLGLPNERRNALEAVLVEFGVARVSANLAKDLDQTVQNRFVGRNESLTSSDDDSHGTYGSTTIRSSVKTPSSHFMR